MLRHDALDLLDDPDARLVADQTVEFTAFLWDLHQQGRLRTDFRPLDSRVGHHVPCHLKALGRPPRRAGAACVDPRPARAYNRRELLGHGRHLRPEGGELRLSLEAGRPMLRGAGPARRAASARRSAAPAGCRWKTAAASAPCTRPSTWPWPTASCPNSPGISNSPSAGWCSAESFDPIAYVCKLLSERSVSASLPAPGTWPARRCLRIRLARGARWRTCGGGWPPPIPPWPALLERSALAVDDEFADDSLTLPEQAEVALLPPVSGGC